MLLRCIQSLHMYKTGVNNLKTLTHPSPDTTSTGNRTRSSKGRVGYALSDYSVSSKGRVGCALSDYRYRVRVG